MDEEGLWTAATRVRNLVRANNIRRGLRREEERPPEDHWKKRFPEYEQELLTTYYRYRGWDEQGIPTKETLTKLGLEFVYEDLKKRGIVS